MRMVQQPIGLREGCAIRRRAGRSAGSECPNAPFIGLPATATRLPAACPPTVDNEIEFRSAGLRNFFPGFGAKARQRSPAGEKLQLFGLTSPSAGCRRCRRGKTAAPILFKIEFGEDRRANCQGRETARCRCISHSTPTLHGAEPPQHFAFALQ